MINAAQNISINDEGRLVIEYDWHHSALPENIYLEEMSYPDTSYSFTAFHSEKKNGFTLGFASGNYGHGIFMGGKKSMIWIGKFVVLQATHIFATESVIINDHSMLSWGSVVTDSWLNAASHSIEIRRRMLRDAAESSSRILEFPAPDPVVIEENVWVGFQAIILPGVTLGRGSVIGCNCVIDKDVPPYAVVTGNPSRIIRFLDPDDSEEIKKGALKEYDVELPRR